LCRALHPHRQACLGHPDRDVHPPPAHQSIAFIFISIDPPDQDSSDDYPEIGTSACGEPAEGGRLVLMVASNRDRSHTSSSRYPTIGRSEASDAQTPNDGLIRNPNPDFNTVWVQAILETIQRMTPDGSPLAALALQGAEVVNLIIAEKSADVHRREPLTCNNDWTRHAQSEATSLASSKCRLSEHDARRRITQNHVARECSRD
jgi:hypothetical protein